MAMAYRGGVPLKDMEFVQYHPTGLPNTNIYLKSVPRRRWCATEQRQLSVFTRLRMGPETPLGKPVLKTMELGPRDRVSQSIWHEIQKGCAVKTPWGDCVWLDMRHLGEKKINERLPFVRDISISYLGVDPVIRPVAP